MAKDERVSIERTAAWAVVAYAFLRIESAIWLGLILVLTILLPNPFDWWPWWLWVLLGVVGEGLLVWTSILDERTSRRVVADIYRERFNPRDIRGEENRALVEQALQYRGRIASEMEEQESEVLGDYLRNSLLQITDWVERVYLLAKRIDEYERDPLIRRDLEALPAQISRAEARLRQESSSQVKREIERGLAAKREQLANMRRLAEVMQTAREQINNSLTALGTIYSQLLLMEAKQVDSARAKQIAANLHGQVSALQDVITTMNEVYGDAV